MNLQNLQWAGAAKAVLVAVAFLSAHQLGVSVRDGSLVGVLVSGACVVSAAYLFLTVK
jgi:hypothetical protein